MSTEQCDNFDALGLEADPGDLAEGVVVVDSAGSVLLTNHERQLGRGRHLSGLPRGVEVFHPDGRAYEEAEWPLARTLGSGEMIAGEEFYAVAADGSRRSFTCTSAPFCDDHGRVVGAVSVVRDVTEERRCEQQLAYLLPGLDHREDAIIAFDARWRVTVWNNGAERMYRYSAVEALGREFRSFMRLHFSDEPHAAFRLETAHLGRWHREVAVERDDGSVLAVKVINVAIRGEAGEIIGYVSIHRDMTERHRTEAALREANRRCETILEGISEAFCALDSQWRCVHVNQGTLDRVGQATSQPITLDGLVGKNLWETFPQLVGTAVDRELHRAVREHKTVGFENYSPATDRWLEIHAYPSPDGGLFVYGRDITERRQAEQAERDAHRRCEAILDSISDTFFALDREWRYTYVNRRAVAKARQAWGREVSPEELLGKNCWELFPEAVGTTLDRELRRAARGHVVVEFETYSPSTNAWIAVRAFPSGDGLSVYSRDITARKRDRQQQAYYASLLDNVEDGVIATDADDFRITAWNQGAERLYGFMAREVLGRPAREVGTYPGDESRLPLERELAATGRTRVEFTAHRRDGIPIEVELIAVAVKDDNGEITGYLGIHRDVSERKRAERRLYESKQQTETILDSIGEAFLAVDRDGRYRYVNDAALLRIRAWRGVELTRDQIIGKSMGELFPDLNVTAAEQKIRDAIGAQEPVAFEFYFEPTGDWLDAHAYPSSDGLSIHIRDIAHRKAAEEQLAGRLRQQAAVAELGLKALEDGRLKPLMDETVSLVGRTLGVEYSTVAELVPGGDTLLVRAGVGWRAGVVGAATVPTGSGSPIGYALLTGAPVIVDDMTAETRFEVPALVREHEVMSYIGVVIDPRSTPFGVLAAASRKRRTFSQDDVSFVQSLANVLATAVERAQMDERLETARDAERSRIARDLHDQALGGLTDAIATARLAETAGSDTEAARRVERLVPILRQVGHQLRGAIYDLRAPEEEHEALAERLESLVARHRAMTAGVAIEFEVRGETVNPIGMRGTQLLRIAGEALTNARRHSAANTIRVNLWCSDETVSLEISDDGRGFNPADAAGSHGTGIRGMRERAAVMGGELIIDSQPGAGTVVRVESLIATPHRGERTRVLLVEDHASVREAIATVFEEEEDFHVVGEAGSLSEARQMLENVDLAVVDLTLPDGYGGDLIRELRATNPDAQTLVLTASLDRAEVGRAVESGAAAVVNKTVPLEQLLTDVRRLRAGETVLPASEVTELLRLAGRQRERAHRDRQAAASLTEREREVLQALADGLGSQQVAVRLHITIRTERNHVASILRKLGAHSRLQAVVFALRQGVIEIH